MNDKKMKIVKLFVLIIVALSIYWCEETKNATVDTTETIINGRGIKLFVIDSCEYIGSIYRSGGN